LISPAGHWHTHKDARNRRPAQTRPAGVKTEVRRVKVISAALRSNMDRVKRLFSLGTVACALALAATGCASQDPLPQTPTVVAPPTVVETFSGSLIALGTTQHTFTVSQLGEVNITLTATTLEPTIDPETGEPIPPPDPKAVPPLTLSIGTPTTTIFGPVCAALKSVEAKAQAATSPHIIGSALAGNFCVSYADTNGILTNVVDYTIVVAHP